MTDAFHVAHEAGLPWEEDPSEPGVRWRQLVSADRTPSRGLNVGVSEVLPGAKLYRDGEWEPLRQGDVAYIPGGAVHGVRNLGGYPIVLVWAFPTDTCGEIEYFDG